MSSAQPRKAFSLLRVLVTTIAFALIWVPVADGQVRRIVIDQKVSPAFDGARFGEAGQYETLAGRAFGELDPADPHNSLITDIQLAPRNGRGKVEYMATFFLVKPVDMSRSSHLLWHDVPNRTGRLTIVPAERMLGDVGLSSGWQGDRSGRTVPGPANDYASVPIARNTDGSPITGPVMARIANANGPGSQPLMVYNNPVPYHPASLDTRQATLTTLSSESSEGLVGHTVTVASADWAWARCTMDQPFPGIPDPTQICLKGGFDPALLYQVVFTAQNPYVLGIGFVAFRDMASFFRNARADEEGTPNPLADQVSWVVARGVSQSGNFLRAFIQLGFTQDDQGRRVYDAAWPIIAGRRISLNTRFAMPDGILQMYNAGSEGPQWWGPWPDSVRGLPASGILDRCTASRTCPKIIEHFGSTEVWALKLTPEFVGTAADADIPLPDNVRRYYIPSTQHGGGPGGFSLIPGLPPGMCAATHHGPALLPRNPVPHMETVNALRVHMRNWVMRDVAPPPSRWPTLRDGTLVEANKEAMGFPTIPGLPSTAPNGLINPMLEYDWGPDFNHTDGSGVPSIMPPRIKHVIRTLVPKVDADGNELGGVPVVLRDAPLGTYLGWNITSDGFHKGEFCNYAGGFIPFVRTKDERLRNGDPRMSLEERYGTHEGYVRAVEKAAANAVAQGFLLADDAASLVKEAAESDVLKP